MSVVMNVSFKVINMYLKHNVEHFLTYYINMVDYIKDYLDYQDITVY